jgi:hypothetical protein
MRALSDLQSSRSKARADPDNLGYSHFSREFEELSLLGQLSNELIITAPSASARRETRPRLADARNVLL